MNAAPDSSRYDPSPDYTRGLLAAIPLSQRETARRIGVSARYLRALAAGTRICSYPVQFCMEALAAQFSARLSETAPQVDDRG